MEHKILHDTVDEMEAQAKAYQDKMNAEIHKREAEYLARREVPKFTIESVKVLGRHTRATEVRVVGTYEGYKYTARTEIEASEGVPNTVLEGFTAQPAEEFVVALHRALVKWEDGQLVRAEIHRICG